MRDTYYISGHRNPDAGREVSEMLAVGDEEIIRSLHYTRVAEGIFELPGVLSRKKQLLLQVLAVLAELLQRMRLWRGWEGVRLRPEAGASRLVVLFYLEGYLLQLLP